MHTRSRPTSNELQREGYVRQTSTGVYEETVFGATVITLLLTFENVLLTLKLVAMAFPRSASVT